MSETAKDYCVIIPGPPDVVVAHGLTLSEAVKRRNDNPYQLRVLWSPEVSTRMRGSK